MVIMEETVKTLAVVVMELSVTTSQENAHVHQGGLEKTAMKVCSLDLI